MVLVMPQPARWKLYRRDGGCDVPGHGEAMMMDLVVLATPDCPNAPVLEQRLAEALAGRPGLTVRHVEITGLAAAARHGMHGSPTLLVDGADPFAQPGTGPALACRLYRGDDGQPVRVPSVAALRRALEQASG
jgi:hypothetical protein